MMGGLGIPGGIMTAGKKKKTKGVGKARGFGHGNKGTKLHYRKNSK